MHCIATQRACMQLELYWASCVLDWMDPSSPSYRCMHEHGGPVAGRLQVMVTRGWFNLQGKASGRRPEHHLARKCAAKTIHTYIYISIPKQHLINLMLVLHPLLLHRQTSPCVSSMCTLCIIEKKARPATKKWSIHQINGHVDFRHMHMFFLFLIDATPTRDAFKNACVC